ncbi:hypothetical protein BDY21DRAFT_366660 [Lineolata rhizophorae]|uniref:RING-type E3 ubiquitin transferase n=1 Tax=Lineolata rhizophorae TaxID=578093 RepID=A0A6A6NQD6_9PEZI|nr:hypothetical protein BDY21DRAFT_366660 [Lineolata rhizophorae]
MAAPSAARSSRGGGRHRDLMNDPEYATNTEGAKAPEDPDTCRICRGEGTAEEPLFYPCRCSGSIKFVHQECLMEWLSHSQKKYCELCKTSFRFTKLYSPNMPQRLPLSVFLRRAAVHTVQTVLKWCRWVLVAFVWLCWLPWCMRFVWRGLFWLADAGWARDASFMQSPLSTVDAELASRGNSTYNATEVPSQAELSLFGGPALRLSVNTSEPYVFSLFRRYSFLFHARPLVPTSGYDASDLQNSTASATLQGSSLLSDMSFLRNLTSSPAINRLLMDVVEGQIITVLVQQPVLNLAPLNGENQELRDDAARALAQMANQDAQEQGERQEQAPEGEDEEGGNGEGDDRSEVDSEASTHIDSERLSQGEPEEDGQAGIRRRFSGFESLPLNLQQAIENEDQERFMRIAERMPADARERVFAAFPELVLTEEPRVLQVRNLDGHEPSSSSAAENEGENASGEGDSDDEPSGSQPSQRPEMPERGKSSIATEIKRILEEERRNQDLQSTEQTSMDEPDAERGSDGSWQHVSCHGGAPSRNGSRPSSPKGKGKSKASPEQLSSETGDPDRREESSSHLDGVAEASTDAQTTDALGASDDPLDSLSEDGNDNEDGSDSGLNNNPFHPDYEEQNPEPINPAPSPTTTPLGDAPLHPAVNPLDHNQGLWERINNWIWAGIPADDPGVGVDDEGANDERVVQDPANEEPFVPFLDGRPRNEDDVLQAENDEQDPEVARAAAQAGIDVNDPEAVEDAEDLEGMLELIGVQGPIVGLFQNVLFSAILISATVAGAVWIPYVAGKIVLLFLGSPFALCVKMPLQIASGLADLAVDLLLFFGGVCIYWAVTICRGFLVPLDYVRDTTWLQGPLRSAGDNVRGLVDSAFVGITRTFSAASTSWDSDHLYFSMSSHASLRSIQHGISTFFSPSIYVESLSQLGSIFDVQYAFGELVPGIPRAIMGAVGLTAHCVKGWFFEIFYGDALKWTFKLPGSKKALDPSLAYWSATDRMIAVLSGYSCFAIMGALYLTRREPMFTSQPLRKVESVIKDILHQAGGVFKVILIISIEMIVFPLYCGLLLDVALLPIFSTATVQTRMAYMMEHPWIFSFLHWFAGTCYMFHFALFVSMCRKIMRSGVLYFIRDPDDPTFHPVRDVLERNVATQLRKIAFSALVYGALVIVCLGGVVWGLYYGFDNVLPINFTSHTPAPEFPLDLLFYNFLTPLIVKVVKPSEGLHSMYRWWFRKCARALRLTDFLFGLKSFDERGHFVRKTWSAWLAAKDFSSTPTPVFGPDDKEAAEEDDSEVYFIRDGRHVRAPASDQVRIPKGAPVFVEVNESNIRIDGKPDEGVHASPDMVKMVYIPPWFRVRIGLFILTIWAFAAATGLGVTIVPLLFGRRVYMHFDTEVNDVYAFCVGIYTLGGLLYLGFQCQHLYRRAPAFFSAPLTTMLSRTVRQLATAAFRTAKVVYVYTFAVVVLPVLFTLLLECYVLIPLHMYMHAPLTTAATGQGFGYTIHALQDWTLGLLYVRIAHRVFLADARSRPARAARAVVANGYTDPDACVATRVFFLPCAVVFGVALGAPLLLGAAAQRVVGVVSAPPGGSGGAAAVTGDGHGMRVLAYRMAYPALLAAALSAWVAWGAVKAVRRWQSRVKDEVYLIGERLHNFGERRRLRMVNSGTKVKRLTIGIMKY